MRTYRLVTFAGPFEREMMATRQFGFIGAGRMATALAPAALSRPAWPSAVANRRQRSLARGGRAALPAKPAAGLLAGNRQRGRSGAGACFWRSSRSTCPPRWPSCAAALTAEHLVISVAAGVPLATLAAGLVATGTGPRLVRVMPNTPCLVGQGASGYCRWPRGHGRRSRAGEAVARVRRPGV